MADLTKSTYNDADFQDDEIFDDSSLMVHLNKTFDSASLRNVSGNNSALNVSALCCDEEISGYDKVTGRNWVYPTNYPVRDYQFNIIKAAILKNTLVSLPTGLGKTFIAAVIMYNFYRWYPLGKIVFTAPTRPLVAQQIEACYNIVAIPPNNTVEMTGHMQANTRKTHWQSKRVFFATPQVIYNDIQSGICPGDKIRCLVIDEAHRARGNYAYCQIVSTLTELGHKTYRILALSATPGSKVEDVINVVKNLHIAHLELRSENCIDVAPYSHSRKINTIVIKLGPVLTQIRQQYTEILDQYARRLKQMNILPQNVGNLSKGRIVMLYKEFQNKERGARHPQHNYIMKDFTLLIALFHGLELLIKHGSRVFLNFFDEHPEKSWIQSDDRLTSLLERLRDDLGINPLSLNTSILPDGTFPEIPKNLSFGHPKFDKLKEIMLNHFKIAKEQKKDTRAIVFCEYRESVNLVHCLLLQCRPLITPQMFVGQGASSKDGKAVVSQKQQLRVMRSFRSGESNALVATCVAEEGLDVGSVDLIICFDISTRSPVRLVQRCGRTGRERGGQVYILVTEGREHQTLMDCMRQRDGLNKKILQSKEVEANLYKSNPRLIPYDFTPECQKMFISVAKKVDRDMPGPSDNVKKGQTDLRNMFAKASSSSSASFTNGNRDELITKQEFSEMFPEGWPDVNFFAEPKAYWNMTKKSIKEIAAKGDNYKIKLDTWLEWQRSLQKTINIDHSSDSKLLSKLLQYSDAKRFDMPASTQNPTFNTQEIITQKIVLSPIKPKQNRKKQKPIIQKSPGKRDGDIRALFSTATKSTKNYTKLINDLGIQDDGSVPTSFINLLVDLSVNNTKSSKPCYICQHLCNCAIIQNNRQLKHPQLSLRFLVDPKLPDIDLIDDITVDDIRKLNKNKHQEVLDFSVTSNRDEVNMDANCSNNFDLDFDFDSPVYGESAEQNIDKIIKSPDKNSEKNFDIGEIDDLFDDSSPEEAINEKVVSKSENNSNDPKNTLGFFGLDSIDDIFAESGDETITESSRTPEKRNTSATNTENLNIPNRVSPSILSGRAKSETSPILCSQVRKFQLSTKKHTTQTSTPNQSAKRKLWLPSPKLNAPTSVSINDSHLNKNDHSTANTANNESKLTITQIVEMINKGDKEKSILENCKVPNYTLDHIDGNTSPILLTQADRLNNLSSVSTTEKHDTTSQSQNKKAESLIILESDSDSSADTVNYEINDNNNDTKKDFKHIQCLIHSPNNKRKLDLVDEEPMSLSPYFNKKIKLDNDDAKTLTLQKQILAALTTNKENKKFKNDMSINFMSCSIKQTSQKENRSPELSNNKLNNDVLSTRNDNDFGKCLSNSSHKLVNTTLSENCPEKDDLKEVIKSKLEQFKRDSKSNLTPTIQNGSILDRKPLKQSRKINFNDSDDDFVSNQNNDQNSKTSRLESLTNHKVRKKRRKANQFLDLEAVLSDEDSGDELTDDSTGSIAEFICDDNESHHNDIQALYLRSVKSPVKGVFKIPQLPKQYNKHDVFSQFIEEDNYEMDSFCVDSHIELTQINDLSALELAEMKIESQRRKKKSHKRAGPVSGDDSPLIRRKKVPRKIDSDSDDSS